MENERISLYAEIKFKNGKLQKAVEKCGSVKKLAEFLEYSVITIYAWLNFRSHPRITEEGIHKFSYLTPSEKLEDRLIFLTGFTLNEIFPLEIRLKPLTDEQLKIKRHIEITTEQFSNLSIKELNYNPNLLDNERKDGIKKALAQLKPKHKEVIIKRFGLNNQPALTHEEIAIELGVTRERVRQIEKQALSHLRHPSQVKFIKELI
jgi:RNA polymerase sigma factor (sigma-70 family)